jgi:hypothetical protein
MTRKQAFLIHLGISGLALVMVLALVFLVWYPYPFNVVTGVVNGLEIFIGAFLVLGPLLTLILFKPGKAGLKFDMYLVAVIQSAFLLYSSYTLYQERPYYIVFSQDRFEVLTYAHIDQEQITYAALLSKPWLQPVYAVASMPTDVQEQQRILEETLFEGKPDIHQRPVYWHPYSESFTEVSRGSRPLSDLLERRPDKATEIESLIEASDDGAELIYAPIIGKERVFSLVLDSGKMMPVGFIDVDPWKKLTGSGT